MVDKTVQEKLAAARIEWDKETREQLRLARIKCDQEYEAQLEEKIGDRLAVEKVNPSINKLFCSMTYRHVC